MLHAGASVITITPPLGMPLAGQFYHREARTIDDDLTARTLVLDDGTGRTRIALVVCDLIGITAATVAEARAAITDRCGIPGDRVMISCTHTHTGPSMSESVGLEPDPAYMAWATERIADGVAVAVARLEPARVAYGAADVDGICFNRRFHMRNGTVVFNPGLGNPEIVGPAGPTDPQVTTLLVENAVGEPLAVWACLSTHYVGTDDEWAISADYYGHFARRIGQWLGDRCVGILAIGTAGNINTVDVEQALPLKGTAKARLAASATAAAAIQATAMQRRHDEPIIETRSVRMSAQRWPITAEDVALARSILDQPDDAELDAVSGFSFVVGQPIPGWQGRTYAKAVLDLAEMPPENETEVQVLRVGDFAVVALPGEVFVEFGLAIKAASPFARVAVVGLANDQIGYLPTREAFGQGGYETWRNRTSWTASGTGEAMVELALGQLRAMRQQVAAGVG